MNDTVKLKKKKKLEICHVVNPEQALHFPQSYNNA